MSKLAEIQHTIKVHSQDLQEELAELVRWEDEMERKNRVATSSRDVFASAAPIRGTTAPQTSPTQKSEAPKSSADVAKEQGNEYFRKGNYEEAIRLYSKGIEAEPVGPTAHVLYANRSMCNLKVSRWSEAESDATKALDLDRGYTKAYFRRAMARKNMGSLRDARKDLEAVLAFNPSDAETIAELKAVTLLLREKEKQAEVKPKKKLIIEEVEDDEEEASDVKETSAAPKVQTPIESHAADASSKNTTNKSAPGKPLKLNSNVEELDDEDDQVEVEKDKMVAVMSKEKAKEVVKANEDEKKKSQPKFTRQKKIQIVAPRSFSEFERTHSEIDGDAELLAEFFSLIDPSSMASLFGVSLTTEVFCDWMRFASRKPADVAFHTLMGLSSVRRIEELTMFLSDEEALLVKEAIHHASASGRDMSQIKESLQ